MTTVRKSDIHLLQFIFIAEIRRYTETIFVDSLFIIPILFIDVIHKEWGRDANCDPAWPARWMIEEQPCPVPGPGEVLVRVEAALTDGTDLKVFRRGYSRQNAHATNPVRA